MTAKTSGSADNIQTRILKNVFVASTRCWVWLGTKSRDGYGRIGVNGKKAIEAHCASYEAFIGPVPNGKEIDHTCGNRACVNPKHLEAVTHRENVLRGNSPGAVNARKTECPKGHPLSGDNLYRWTNPKTNRSFRRCKTCLRAREAKRDRRGAK